jgi:acyl-CoA thioesterase
MDPAVKAALMARAGREPYARRLGLRVVDLDAGYARVEMDVTAEMANVFETCHGGAIFSLMDEAFQLACNSHGTVAVALNVDISYLAPAQMDSRITAEAREIHRTRKTALYDIRVSDHRGKAIAACQALAYRKGDPLPFL